MKLFIGALALTVIGAIFVMPVELLLGWSSLTAAHRQSLGAITKNRGKLSHIERQLSGPTDPATALN
jgi:hypothetical protein